MAERRREKRHVVSFPVVVESQGRFSFVSVTKNVSTKGLLVLTAGKLEVGERVEIAYRAKGRTVEDHGVVGRIVRVDPNEGEGRELWPYVAAIEFSGPLPDIEDLVQSFEAGGEDS
jgi:hypothetical protein